MMTSFWLLTNTGRAELSQINNKTVRMSGIPRRYLNPNYKLAPPLSPAAQGSGLWGQDRKQYECWCQDGDGDNDNVVVALLAKHKQTSQRQNIHLRTSPGPAGKGR